MQYLGHHLAATENVLSELENWMEHILGEMVVVLKLNNGEYFVLKVSE